MSERMTDEIETDILLDRLIRIDGQELTRVVGRNGSGKSSFAEALELRLCGSVDADQGARQRSSASHGDIDRGGQPIGVGILGADDDPGMSCGACVQANEVPPVEGQDRPVRARGELQNGIVWDSLVGLASLERRQHIMPQPAECLDPSRGKLSSA